MTTRLELWRKGLDACMHAIMSSHEAIKLYLTGDGLPTTQAHAPNGRPRWEVGVYTKKASFEILEQDMADAVQDQRRKYG